MRRKRDMKTPTVTVVCSHGGQSNQWGGDAKIYVLWIYTVNRPTTTATRNLNHSTVERDERNTQKGVSPLLQ